MFNDSTTERRPPHQVMIRHTKSDVLAIPPPVRESVILTMSQQEALAYSTIVSFVRFVDAIVSLSRVAKAASVAI